LTYQSGTISPKRLAWSLRNSQCAEEYFWYKKKRIDDLVWDSWSAGMNYWYNHESGIIKELWKKEIENKRGLKSYYINNGDEFFKKDNK
jgi:hypothetical protein